METRVYAIHASLSSLSVFVSAADLVGSQGYLPPTIVRVWLSSDSSNYRIEVSALPSTHAKLAETIVQ